MSSDTVSKFIKSVGKVLEIFSSKTLALGCLTARKLIKKLNRLLLSTVRKLVPKS